MYYLSFCGAGIKWGSARASGFKALMWLLLSYQPGAAVSSADLVGGEYASKLIHVAVGRI